MGNAVFVVTLAFVEFSAIVLIPLIVFLQKAVSGVQRGYWVGVFIAVCLAISVPLVGVYFQVSFLSGGPAAGFAEAVVLGSYFVTCCIIIPFSVWFFGRRWKATIGVTNE
ncbi:MAG: hypothetical protein ABJL67_05640 [Sulfitobacter sp.]